MTQVVVAQTRDPRGNRHRFDPAVAARVAVMAMHRLPQRDIAVQVGMSVPTLIRLYRRELDTGAASGSATIAQKHYELAASGAHPQVTQKWAERYLDFAMPVEKQTGGGQINIFVNTGIRRRGDDQTIEIDAAGRLIDHQVEDEGDGQEASQESREEEINGHEGQEDVREVASEDHQDGES